MTTMRDTSLMVMLTNFLTGIRDRATESPSFRLDARPADGKPFRDFTAADGYRYRVTVEWLGKVRKPLPTRDGTLISWSRPANAYPHMARLENGTWYLLTAAKGIVTNYSPEALQGIIPDADNWKVILP